MSPDINLPAGSFFSVSTLSLKLMQTGMKYQFAS